MDAVKKAEKANEITEDTQKLRGRNSEAYR